MTTSIRIATWIAEDDGPSARPSLAARMATLRSELARLRANVLVLQEVNGSERAGEHRPSRALEALLSTAGYERYAVRTTTDVGEASGVRNLVIASRLGLLSVAPRRSGRARPAHVEAEADPVERGRPILCARLEVGDGRVLHVVNLHLRPRLAADRTGQARDGDAYWWTPPSGWAEGSFMSSMKRVGQALEARMLVDEIFDADPGAWIAVFGDFDAASHEVPVAAIRGSVDDPAAPELTCRALVPCESAPPVRAPPRTASARRAELLDHLLVSRPLLALYRGAEILRDAPADGPGTPGSDPHAADPGLAPVVAEFELPGRTAP